MAKKLTQAKAEEMLHNPPHGKPLTDKQRKFFGAVASGAPVKLEHGGKMITCPNCGHSWDKSTSTGKDAHVCHICGKGNVPTAQDGATTKITPEMIKGWGEYRNYLSEQGLYGDPRLNTAFGKKTFVDWATKNPNYGVNWETLPIIGEELAAHKQKVKEAVARGKVSLSTPISEFNATDVTNAKSKNPWWPGTEFTSQEFADYVEKVKDSSGKVIKEKNYGVLPSTETYDKNRLNVDKKDIPVKIVKSIAKQKDGGWLDKYEDGGEEYLGTTNKGFNYNGAWGGTMAMGGSMPGAVGFTYARTGSIPDNGPYAKKTMASAQNGMEMKFYQEGLDWKPKSISKNGSVIKDDRGQWAHPGEITEIGSPYITMEGVPYPVLGVSDTGHTQMMYPGEDYKFKGKKVTEYPVTKNWLEKYK